MNEIPMSAKFAPPRDVTSGPIRGSRKVYASLEDVRISAFRSARLRSRTRTSCLSSR